MHFGERCTVSGTWHIHFPRGYPSLRERGVSAHSAIILLFEGYARNIVTRFAVHRGVTGCIFSYVTESHNLTTERTAHRLSAYQVPKGQRRGWGKRTDEKIAAGTSGLPSVSLSTATCLLW